MTNAKSLRLMFNAPPQRHSDDDREKVIVAFLEY
jgi:hypothetical protein